jgi:ABC-type dipeptide/oligopeptide/nickel transport system ATPase component
VEPPSGCRFHPRCPKVMDICPLQEPPLKTPGGGQDGRRVACWLYREGA